jgi:hypothetical protein
MNRQTATPSESSLVTYLPLRTDVSSMDLLIKRGTMIYIKS